MGIKYPYTAWGCEVKMKINMLGWTQNDVAEKAGTTYYKVSRLIRGIYKEDALEKKIDAILNKALSKAS